MEPERVWALLWHSRDGGMSREEFMDLSAWEMSNVMFRPGRDEKTGDYWPVPRATKTSEPPAKIVIAGSTPNTFKEIFIKIWADRGLTPEQVTLRWEEKHGRHRRRGS